MKVELRKDTNLDGTVWYGVFKGGFFVSGSSTQDPKKAEEFLQTVVDGLPKTEVVKVVEVENAKPQ